MVDLDSVCVDFTSSVADYFDIKNLPINLPEGLYPWFGNEEHEMRKKLNTLMEDQNFWLSLKPYKWSNNLLQTCQSNGNVYFLSKARPNSGCMAGKMAWVKKYYPEMEEKVILTTKDKWVCSSPNRILIDDDLRHKNGWEKFGGIFYHWLETKDCCEGFDIIENRLIDLNIFLKNEDNFSKTTC